LRGDRGTSFVIEQLALLLPFSDEKALSNRCVELCFGLRLPYAHVESAVPLRTGPLMGKSEYPRRPNSAGRDGPGDVLVVRCSSRNWL
jgi:hypothetical protein